MNNHVPGWTSFSLHFKWLEIRPFNSVVLLFLFVIATMGINDWINGWINSNNDISNAVDYGSMKKKEKDKGITFHYYNHVNIEVSYKWNNIIIWTFVDFPGCNTITKGLTVINICVTRGFARWWFGLLLYRRNRSLETDNSSAALFN